MKPVILIANLAGGVGKTTLTQAIATASAEYGKKTLAIDADPNATLTFLTGIENPRFTLREVMEKSVRIEDCATRTLDRYSLIPSASRLLFADGKVPDFQSEEFDVVLIDSSSGPSSLLPQLIEIATYVLIPVDGSIISIRGALNLNDFISRGQSQSQVKIVTNNSRNYLNYPEVLDQLKKDIQFLESNIPFDSTANQGQELLQSPLSFATNSDFAAGIRELTYEILDELKLV